MKELTYIEEELIKTLTIHTEFAYDAILEAYNITHSIDRTISAISLASCLDAPLSTAAHAVAKDGKSYATSVTEPGKIVSPALMYFAKDNYGEPGDCIEGELPREFWCVFTGGENGDVAQFVSPRGIVVVEDEEEDK